MAKIAKALSRSQQTAAATSVQQTTPSKFSKIIPFKKRSQPTTSKKNSDAESLRSPSNNKASRIRLIVKQVAKQKDKKNHADNSRLIDHRFFVKSLSWKAKNAVNAEKLVNRYDLAKRNKKQYQWAKFFSQHFEDKVSKPQLRQMALKLERVHSLRLRFSRHPQLAKIDKLISQAGFSLMVSVPSNQQLESLQALHNRICDAHTDEHYFELNPSQMSDEAKKVSTNTLLTDINRLIHSPSIPTLNQRQFSQLRNRAKEKLKKYPFSATLKELEEILSPFVSDSVPRIHQLKKKLNDSVGERVSLERINELFPQRVSTFVHRFNRVMSGEDCSSHRYELDNLQDLIVDTHLSFSEDVDKLSKQFIEDYVDQSDQTRLTQALKKINRSLPLASFDEVMEQKLTPHASDSEKELAELYFYLKARIQTKIQSRKYKPFSFARRLCMRVNERRMITHKALFQSGLGHGTMKASATLGYWVSNAIRSGLKSLYNLTLGLIVRDPINAYRYLKEISARAKIAREKMDRYHQYGIVLNRRQWLLCHPNTVRLTTLLEGVFRYIADRGEDLFNLGRLMVFTVKGAKIGALLALASAVPYFAGTVGSALLGKLPRAKRNEMYAELDKRVLIALSESLEQLRVKVKEGVFGSIHTPFQQEDSDSKDSRDAISRSNLEKYFDGADAVEHILNRSTQTRQELQEDCDQVLIEHLNATCGEQWVEALFRDLHNEGGNASEQTRLKSLLQQHGLGLISAIITDRDLDYENSSVELLIDEHKHHLQSKINLLLNRHPEVIKNTLKSIESLLTGFEDYANIMKQIVEFARFTRDANRQTTSDLVETVGAVQKIAIAHTFGAVAGHLVENLIQGDFPQSDLAIAQDQGDLFSDMKDAFLDPTGYQTAIRIDQVPEFFQKTLKDNTTVGAPFTLGEQGLAAISDDQTHAKQKVTPQMVLDKMNWDQASQSNRMEACTFLNINENEAIFIPRDPHYSVLPQPSVYEDILRGTLDRKDDQNFNIIFFRVGLDRYLANMERLHLIKLQSYLQQFQPRVDTTKD